MSRLGPVKIKVLLEFGILQKIKICTKFGLIKVDLLWYGDPQNRRKVFAELTKCAFRRPAQ